MCKTNFQKEGIFNMKIALKDFLCAIKKSGLNLIIKQNNSIVLSGHIKDILHDNKLLEYYGDPVEKIDSVSTKH